MAQPETQEIASVARDPMAPMFLGNTMQPTDETLRQRGGAKGFSLYDEIRRDPHAFALLQKRSLEVASREWVVDAASTRRVDTKAAEEVERQLKELNIDRLTVGLLGAVLKGFAVGEVMWANQGGVWVAVKVKVRKQRRFRMTPDGELRLLTRESGFDGIAVPDRKFIVHRHSIDSDDDDPYGLGIGTVLFWPAWFKRQVLTYWLKATEKFAGPTVIATYPGGYEKTRQDELLAAIRSMANDAGLVVPEGVVVQLMEATRGGGGDVYETLSRYLDELMSEAVLGETLSTNAGDRGARSLGEIHNDVRLAIAKADADLVCATLNETLVKWITEINFPAAAPPKLWRNFEEEEDLDAHAERDERIVGMGYKPKDVSYINETYGGEWVEKEAPPAADPAGAVPPPAGGALDALFAENARQREPDTAQVIADKAAISAKPAMVALIQAIGEAVNMADGYDDLAERLLAIVPDLDPAELAGVMEQAILLADLAGRASVIDEVKDLPNGG